MIPTLPKKLTTRQFIKRSIFEANRFNKIKSVYSKKINALNDEYVRLYCKHKTGNVIDLPEGTKEGYSKFLIEKIIPQINTTGEHSFKITFDFHGYFQNNTKGDEVKGILKQSIEPAPETSHKTATN